MFGLVSFGLYSIMVICWSLATFPSCPEAANSLQLVRASWAHARRLACHPKDAHELHSGQHTLAP